MKIFGNKKYISFYDDKKLYIFYYIKGGTSLNDCARFFNK